ncbi:kinase-like protein [Phanerochaete sordida]|uniref:1-phosphatidylinositol 4-kinase n=1 Tax=Phanerochaete sordida TaxID=48140 RepID=A0A9P3G7N4_9APHY|nr:kinase-like protein [Phanerochaete sordida]
MSHALLLRLFLSPSFFSVHVALQYLRIYADNIGITYYLTRRLRELDTGELREVWGFICHLLVTRPSKSRALECFVVEISQRSTHIAMLTLWFMQAHLKDLSVSRYNSESFHICQRILNQCQEMIYGDLPASGTPYTSLNLPTLPGFIRRKVKPNVQPALVGMGVILAGVPGMPALTDIMGEVAIEQGRLDDLGEDLRSLDNPDGIVRTKSDRSNTSQEEKDEEDLSDPEDEGRKGRRKSEGPSDVQAPLTAARLGGQSRKGSGVSRRQTIAAQTSPALPLHLKDPRKSRLSEDPFGQNDPPPSTVVSSPSPFKSTPTFSQSRHIRRGNSSSSADLLLHKYDIEAQKFLLRTHFCRSEIQFLLALENICNRLLVVPKPARVSALRAELTGLNHMLPAEVCMPMWCSSSDKPDPTTGIPEPHHRIVRIPPGESVVLNSAERAPYLLLIEILHGDLDFDPAKRSNKEVLKKIVVKENERAGASHDLIAFNGAGPAVSQLPVRSIDTDRPEKDIEIETTNIAEGRSLEIPAIVSPTSPSDPPEDEEEIDLVEQLYGSSSALRARSIDLSESIVLPPAPKNKELDNLTWSSTPPTPLLPGAVPRRSGLTRSLSSSIVQRSSSGDSDSLSLQTERVLSLDEYSERMRTAAVMLAQLNANLVREPVTAPGTPIPESASPLRWLPGSNWLTVTPPPPDNQAPGESSGPAYPSNVTMRMKLQPTEAAAIRTRIMKEMLALEEERMERMRENRVGEGMLRMGDGSGSMKTAEDEGIIRRELSKADPSAVVVGESWAAKKSRIRQASPYGHLANWDCVSVIVKTGGDLRQEQLAVQLIQEFEKIWKDENCACWVRYFRILITGNNSGLVETITDAVSIHSLKKAEYARRLASGRLGHVTLFDHFKSNYGDPASAKFARAQRNFAKSLAGYSVVTYLLQIKDRHNGNILIDRDGHLIHIDFGFMLSNSPGNIGFEAAPFKLPLEYIEVLGGIESDAYKEFKRLFKEGFDAARKHCDRIVTLVELMQKDSTLPCFTALGEGTAQQLRDRCQQGLTQAAAEEHVERLIDTSLGSNWTRLYDSYQYYSQSIL